MDINKLRIKLGKVENLSELARETNINVRTLRRIRNGYTPDIMLGTMERLVAALAARAKASRE